MTRYYPTFESGFLDDFEDLENVSEMVAETSEAWKDQHSESATGEKFMHVKTTRARACAEKATFQREKRLALL